MEKAQTGRRMNSALEVDGLLEGLKSWARRLKRDVHALWIAARDERTPLAAKCVAAIVAAYAISPIDLIPDFIPVLGYLDDLLIVPLGVLIAIRLIPAELLEEFRRTAEATPTKPKSVAGAIVIVLIWVAAIVAVITWWSAG